MPSEPAFNTWFGNASSQSATDVRIQKLDLIAPQGLSPTYTFEPKEANGPEQLGLALLLRWLRNQDVSADAQFRITQPEQELTYEFGKPQRLYRFQIVIRIDEDANTALPNPNLI